MRGGEEGTEEDELTLKDIVKDIIVSLVVISIIMSAIYVYTENWPPVVVIISSSMVHNRAESDVGTVDIGDIVFIKKVHQRNDITSWVQGRERGYKTYGDYGDVIVYRKDGGKETPVIHRAIVWVDVNETTLAQGLSSMTFDVPSLDLYDVTEFTIKNARVFSSGKMRRTNLSIDLSKLRDKYERSGLTPEGGFLTKGDNNPNVDQVSLPSASGYTVDPVRLEWVVGVARGELPWIGLIKMSFSGEIDPGDQPAANSWSMLAMLIIVLVSFPIVTEFVFNVIIHYKERKEEDGPKKGRERGPEKRAPKRH